MRLCAALIVFFCAAVLARHSISAELKIPVGDEAFDRPNLVFGSEATAELCARVPHAAWVTVDGKGDCIRYYPANLSGSRNPDVLVYVPGDTTLLTLGNNYRVNIEPAYLKQSPAKLEALVAGWSKDAGRPYIYLTRPGSHGSSGNHQYRKQPRETALLTATLDTIKAKYGIERFHMTGQSGGGYVTAAMLTRRSDIGCASIASGSTALMKRAAEQGRTVDNTGLPDPYDPVSHIARIPRNPEPKIIILSDPLDARVSFSSQLYYVTQLRQAGYNPLHVIALANGNDRHDLAAKGRVALRRCVHGISFERIRAELENTELATTVTKG